MSFSIANYIILWYNLVEITTYYCEDDMALLDTQEIAVKNLKEQFAKYDKIQFVGEKGYGRTHTLHSMADDYYIVEVEGESGNNSLQSIIDALYKYKNIVSTLDTKFSIGFSGKVLFLGVDSHKVNFFSQESLIIKFLKKLSTYPKRNNPKPIVIAIKLSACDKCIDNFLHFALKKLNAKSDILKVVYLTSVNQLIDDIPAVYLLPLTESKLPNKELLANLNLRPEILKTLSKDEIDFIFNITMNNFHELKKIVNELNANIISFINKSDNKNTLSSIIDKCIEASGLSRTNDIMKYCAYASMENAKITQNALEYLVEVEQNQLSKEIECAKNLNILNKQDDYISILLELVNMIVVNKSINNKEAIYERFNRMLSYMYPSNYKIKYRFMSKIDEQKSHLILMQYLLQKIRHRTYVPQANELPQDLKDFVSKYAVAVNYSIQLEYDKTIDTLKNYLNDSRSIVSAEAKLIVAQAYMKSLDEAERSTALDLLSSIVLKNCDGNLRYRIIMCKLSALIHKGRYSEAKQEFENLSLELVNKIEHYSSHELRYNYNVLLRKANMVYHFQLAKGMIELSKNYFKQNQENYTDYFYALCNALAIHLENMNLELAKEDVEDFEALKFQYGGIAFKRQYIFDNNLILYKYFAKIQNAKETADQFNTLLKQMNGNADRYLISCNYAVFKALAGDVKGAYDFIEKNLSIVNDKEGIYAYRAIVNSTIMEFVLDNSNKDELLKRINSLHLEDELPNKSFKVIELKNICKVITNSNCTTIEQWMKEFNALMPKNRPLNIYEQGFMITPLYNWDDD